MIGVPRRWQLLCRSLCGCFESPQQSRCECHPEPNDYESQGMVSLVVMISAGDRNVASRPLPHQSGIFGSCSSLVETQQSRFGPRKHRSSTRSRRSGAKLRISRAGS